MREQFTPSSSALAASHAGRAISVSSLSAQNLFVPDTSRTKGIEISFRYLKHANGLLYFHSKKPEFLKQEIYANPILYNFGIFLANEAAEENLKKKRKKGNKYNYEIETFHQH